MMMCRIFYGLGFPNTLLSLSLAILGSLSVTSALPNNSNSNNKPAATPPTYAGVPTATLVHSNTQTSLTSYLWISPRLVEMRRTQTETTLAPGPFPPAQLPTTVTEWVVSTVTVDTRFSFYVDNGQVISAAAGGSVVPQRVSTSTDSFSAKALATYGVWPPAATYLAAAATVPCAGDVDGPKPDDDRLCAAQNLTTACQSRQCDVRADGAELWCLQRFYGLRDSQPAMGRACWGGDSVFVQLLKPCLKGDRMVGCKKENGPDALWTPRQWQGPGAEGSPYVP